MSKLSKNLIIAAGCFIALITIVFFPLVAGSAAMKWDAMDLYLPWKFFVTESLSEGFLPLWNPSLNGGFPQMGDPGTWYPVSWMIGWIGGGYSVYSTQIEYLVHLFIAGTGMYVLIYSKLKNRGIAILIGCAFMFSGVFIANAQHIGWIVGASWLPWILWTYKKWINGSSIAAVLFALTLFFQLSGGYPGVFFITAYILLFYFLFDVFKFLKEKELMERFHPVRQIVIFVVLFLSLSGIVVFSSFDMADQINRGGSVEAHSGSWDLLLGSLTLPSFASFIVPFATAKNDQSVWGFDFSMINVFIGGLVFLAILSQLFVKGNDRKIRIYTVIGILFFMIALGNELPLRNWIAHLPLMKLFRFPSLFRLFGDFFLLLAAAYAFREIFSKPITQKIYVRWLIVFGIVAIGFTAFQITQAERWRFLKLPGEGFLNFYETAGIREFVILQLILFIGFVGILIVIYFFKQPWFKLVLIVSCICELAVATWLNRYATVMENRTIAFASGGMEQVPDRFPVPKLLPMTEFSNDKCRTGFTYLWRNIPIYKKVPSHDGHSPYSLLTQQKALELGLDTVMVKYPFAFVCSSLNGDRLDLDKESRGEVVIRSFTPNASDFTVKMSESGYLILNQNFYPHWKGKLDGKTVAVKKVNVNYMAVFVPEGTHQVSFLFKPPGILIYWYLMVSALGISLLILVVYIVRSVLKEK